MQSKKVWMLGLLLIVAANLLLAACGDEVAITNGPPTPTPVPISSLNVLDKQELTLGLPARFYLSPDGATILGYDGKELCFYNTAGVKQNCTSSDAPFDRASIRWSPDSRKVVLTEDFFRQLVDSDIWVLDAATAKLTDLTEDNLKGQVLFGDKYKDTTVFADTYPTWSKDSQRILFQRISLKSEERRASFQTLPVAGGTPTQLIAFLTDDALNRAALSWSPDGKTIAFSYADNTLTDPKNGAYLVNADGTNLRQVLKSVRNDDPKDATQLPPSSLDFSPDGRNLLMTFGYFAAQYTTAYDVSIHRVVAVDGSSGPTKIDAAGMAYYAAWSPGGTGLVYIARDFKNLDNNGLFLVDKPGGTGRRILEGEFRPIGDDRRNLDWAANNTLILQNIRTNKVSVVKLGTK